MSDDHLVGSNPELPLEGVRVLLQDAVHKLEELLHDCILPHVIITRLDLYRACKQFHKLEWRTCDEEQATLQHMDAY